VKELTVVIANKITALEEKLDARIRDLEESLEPRVLDLEEKNSYLEEKVLHTETENADLRRQLKGLQGEVLKAKNHAVSNEQYSRKNNVKIFGLAEEG
jgi:predicted nuclease with TOPRIM domain